jgi:ATP-dependent Zn protease
MTNIKQRRTRGPIASLTSAGEAHTSKLPVPKHLALRVIAYHEAGHAVAFLVIGEPPLRVEISVGEGTVTPGYTRDDDPVREESEMRLRAIDDVAATLAGPFAQARIMRVSRDEAMRHPACRVDMELVEDTIQDADLGCDEYIWSEAARKTATILKRNWAAVERLAAALLEHRSLTGEQVQKIVGEVRA